MTLSTPEFLQTKTYSARRDRLAFQHGGGIQPGTWDMADFVVSQRAAGANLSVDVASGYALVPANDPGNAGLYHIQNDATVNVTGFSNGHATLPRIDSVYVQVNDTTDGGDGTDAPTFGIVTGTATAGSTLDNRTGATAIPTGALLLADVFMAATASTVTTANIRDRRSSAKMGWFKVVSTFASGGSITLNTPTLWGGVDHIRVVGRIRSTRAASAATGCRFNMNGVAGGYIIVGGVDNGTPVAATTAVANGYLGQMPAINSDGLGFFELDLPYGNTIWANTSSTLNSKAYHALMAAWISSGSVYANERPAGLLAPALSSVRCTSVGITDDVGSALDAQSFGELWVFGG